MLVIPPIHTCNFLLGSKFYAHICNTLWAYPESRQGLTLTSLPSSGGGYGHYSHFPEEETGPVREGLLQSYSSFTGFTPILEECTEVSMAILIPLPDPLLPLQGGRAYRNHLHQSRQAGQFQPLEIKAHWETAPPPFHDRVVTSLSILSLLLILYNTPSLK